jgi:hypothetical protein
LEENGVPGVAERLLAMLVDGSPVLFGVGLLGVLALDVRTHIVLPVLRAYGRRWAARIETPMDRQEGGVRPRARLYEQERNTLNLPETDGADGNQPAKRP